MTVRLVSRSIECMELRDRTPSISNVWKFGVQVTFVSMFTTFINSIKEVFRHGNRTD